MKIELDVKIGQTVYIEHKQYEIEKINIEMWKSYDEDVTTEEHYYLKPLFKDIRNTVPEYYFRKDFMDTFEYKTFLIDLVNELDDIS